jgi:tetratricopeptide (TPR) repeat protein
MRGDPSEGAASRTAVAAIALLLLSLAVHAVVARQYLADPFFDTYISDALSYHEWAKRMLAAGLGAEPVFHQSPLFPVALAWVYGLGAESLQASRALWMQLILGSCAIALLAPLGRLYLGSTTAGTTAGLIALLHGPFVYYDLKLLPIPLALLTQAIGMLLLARARSGTRAWIALPAGASWGLACLARSEMLLFLPVALIALWRPEVAATAARRTRRMRALLYLIGTAALVAPATLHNLHQGDFVLIASGAGENLYIGNQRGASGGHKPLHAQAGDLFSQRTLAEMIAEQETGRDLRPSEISSFWRERAVQEILAAPGAWVRLELLKLGRVLHPGDPNDMYPYALERDHFLRALHALMLPPGVLWILGLAGAIAAARRMRGRIWPLLALLALHLLVLMVFFASTRLRLPLMYCLTPFAGYAVVLAARAWRARRRRPLLALLAAAGVLLVVASATALRPTTRDVQRLAAVLSTQDRLDDSLKVLEPALSAADPEAAVLDQAGWVHYKKGNLIEARGLYERALEKGLPASRQTQTRTRLAWVYERLGELEEAAAQHDLAAHGDDANAGTFYERGMFLLRRSRTAEAVRDLRRSVELDPRYPPPREALRALGVPPP